MSLEWLRLIFTKRGLLFTVSRYKSSFWFFKYIEISFDRYAKIDIDTVAADVMQYFQIIMILAYFVGKKGVSTPPTFSVFQL